jgi:hypothetical protein
MKSIHFSLLTAFVVLSLNAGAQEDNASKFYVKVYGGYGLITPGSYKLESYSVTNDGTDNISVSKQGLGSGIRAGAGIGVIANDFLNIGVDVEYLKGSKLKSNSEYRSGAYSNIADRQFDYTCISVTPHVIFKAISKPDYLIYNKVGILLNLPFDLNVTGSDTTVSNGGAYTGKTITTGVYKIKLSAGLNVALGVQFTISEKLRGFGEVFGNYLVISPESYTETWIQDNNNSGAYTKNTRTTTIEYIKEGTLTYSYSSKNNDAGGIDETNKWNASVSTNRFNMNAIGINIGVAYRF